MSAPKLRFPGFAGEWEEKPLGDIASFSKGKGISKADISASGATPCIRYGELYTHYGTRIDEVLSATDVPVSELKLSQGGEVIVPASGEDARDIATAAVVLRRGVALGGDLNIIRSASDGFFLASYIAGKKRLTLAAMAQGNSVVHLYPAQLGSLALSFPTLPEQKKIAAFLGAVDAKLAALAAKQAALARFKAGVMHKLFSQQLRFTRDNGSAFPDWQEMRLGDVAQVAGGGTPESHVPEYWNGDIVWFTPTEIKSKYLQRSRRTISPDGLKNSSAKLLPVGALLLSTRATVGDVGIATVECCTNQGFQSLIVKARHSNEFWYYWLLNNKKAILRKASGSTFLEIGKSEVLKLPVSVPHPDEQQKIANALTEMDAKIQAVADQITRLQTFKKGLLQQMFV